MKSNIKQLKNLIPFLLFMVNLVPISSKAKTLSFTTSIEAGKKTGLCIDPVNITNKFNIKNGTPAQLYPCAESNIYNTMELVFEHINGGMIQDFLSDGRFGEVYRTEESKIKLRDTNICLDINRPLYTDLNYGDPVVYWNCKYATKWQHNAIKSRYDGGSGFERKYFVSGLKNDLSESLSKLVPSSFKNSRWSMDNGERAFCLDVPGANFKKSIRLQVWKCNDTSAQLFRFNYEYRFESSGEFNR